MRLFIFLLLPLSLFAAEDNVIHFPGSIIAFPLKVVNRCIKDAAEHKRSQVCSVEDEQATQVKSDVEDFSSSAGTRWREIMLIFQ